MRPFRILPFLLVFLGAPLVAQQAAPEPQEDLRAMVRQLAASLQQTQNDLHEARTEIRVLRAELDQVRTTRAQPDPDPPSDQLSIMEENEQVLESRVEQLDQTKVETASKYRVKLDGMLLFNAGFNRGEVDTIDVPNVAVHRVDGQHPGSIFGTLRQSLIGLQVIGPTVAGASTTAEFHLDFFGGFPNELDSTAMGLVRLRVALARLDWKFWSLRVGQDQPFISPNVPTSLASVGTPALGYSGNLWTWTPQIVGERRWSLGERTQARLEFGVMDPFDGEPPPDSFERRPEAGERSRVPAIAVRQSLRIGGARPAVIGVGGWLSRQNYGFERTVQAWAGTLDWDVPLGSKFALSGAFFRGRGLGGLWGGIGASETFNGPPDLASSAVRGVNAIGGWSQLKYSPIKRLEFNGVFGMDNPYAEDILFSKDPGYQPYLRNKTVSVNVIGHLSSNLLAALEYRHLATTQYDTSLRTAEHINLALGVKF